MTPCRVAQQNLRQVGVAATLARAKQQIVILAAYGVGAVPIFPKPGRLTHKCGVDEFERMERPPGNVGMRGGIGTFAEGRAAAGKEHRPSADQIDFRMVLEEAHLFVQA